MASYLKYRTDSFATHQPVLYQYVKNTVGDILELGCGYGSTSLLIDAIKGTSKKLISVDDNKEWIDKMKKLHPESANHTYIYVPRNSDDSNDVSHWENFHKNDKLTYGVVFIDQSTWVGRIVSLNHFKNSAGYIVIHDADYFPTHKLFGTTVNNVEFEKSFNFDDVFKTWELYFPPKPWAYEPTGPPTLVGTNKNLSLFTVDWNLDKQ